MLKIKKSMEELLGIFFISILVFLAVFSYFISSLKTPKNNDFDWKTMHLEYLVQTFLSSETHLGQCVYTNYELIQLAINSENFICPKNPTITYNVRYIVESELEKFIRNYALNEGDSFFISIQISDWSYLSSINGKLGNKQFSFEECIKRPYSLISSYTYSSNLQSFDGYIKISYCKLII